jgi:hypothetical protein
VTTGELAEVAVAGPDAFVAVTLKRTVPPTFVDVNANVGPIAPAAWTQLSPSALQSCHW